MLAGHEQEIQAERDRKLGMATEQRGKPTALGRVTRVTCCLPTIREPSRSIR